MEYKLLKRGKVKDIYQFDENTLIFKFTNRVSAFDVVLPSEIPMKGRILLKFAKFWFEYLEYPNHMLKIEEPDMMYVRKLEMIPLEFIIRGYLYGSLYERVIRKEIELDVEPILAKKLKEPFFETTTKYEEKDRPIHKEEIISKGWLSEEEFEKLRKDCIAIYEKMKERAYNAGFILADLKLEFGRDKDGRILLADSIGPDEFRLWPYDKYKEGMNQESYDKQPIRDWLIKIGYRDELEKARIKGLPLPTPPMLPAWLIEEVKKRYIEAYEKISGEKFA